jgi:hypothetical protein
VASQNKAHVTREAVQSNAPIIDKASVSHNSQRFGFIVRLVSLQRLIGFKVRLTSVVRQWFQSKAPKTGEPSVYLKVWLTSFATLWLQSKARIIERPIGFKVRLTSLMRQWFQSNAPKTGEPSVCFKV